MKKETRNIYYMRIALAVAQGSKDPNAKVGAVLVDELLNRIVGTGFNGFAEGADDSPELYANQKYKDENIIHAETNALKFFPPKVSLERHKLYCTRAPCPKCTELLLELGITQYAVLEPAYVSTSARMNKRFYQHTQFIQEIEKSGGDISVVSYSELLIKGSLL